MVRWAPTDDGLGDSAAQTPDHMSVRPPGLRSPWAASPEITKKQIPMWVNAQIGQKGIHQMALMPPI